MKEIDEKRNAYYKQKKKTREKIDFCGLVKKQILFFTMQNKASCPDFFLKKKIVHVIMKKTAASIIEKIKTMLHTKVYFQAVIHPYSLLFRHTKISTIKKGQELCCRKFYPSEEWETLICDILKNCPLWS